MAQSKFDLQSGQRHVVVTITWADNSDHGGRETLRAMLGQRIFRDPCAKQVEVVEGDQRVAFPKYTYRVWSGENGTSTLDVIVTFVEHAPIDYFMHQWNAFRNMAARDRAVAGITVTVNGVEVTAADGSQHRVGGSELIFATFALPGDVPKGYAVDLIAPSRPTDL